MKNIKLFKTAILTGIASIVTSQGLAASENNIVSWKAPFTLPELPYETGSLAPSIDKKTMEIHYGKHHAGYVTKLNIALKDSPLASKKLEEILANVSAAEPALRNNAGGHYNHSLFWSILSPEKTAHSQKMTAAIEESFGSFEAFQTQLNDAAKSQFGSGWAWLIVKKDGKLAVTSTPNQDNPLMEKLVKETGTPILALDIWEHAYYLNYQNKRADYVSAFWNVINWNEVEKRYEAATK